MPALPEKDFDALEGRLAATLKPVRAQHVFVQNIRQRIAATGPAIAVRRAPDPRSFLILLTGLLSAFVLAAAVARLLFFLITLSK